MTDRGRNGTNRITLSPAVGPAGTNVTVTVTAANGVLGWIGAVFDEANNSVVGITARSGGMALGTERKCATHSAVNTGNSASFNWTVPTGTADGKSFKAKVISLNGARGSGAAQNFAFGEATFIACSHGSANCTCKNVPFLTSFLPEFCDDASLRCIDGLCRTCENGLETCSCMAGGICNGALVCNAYSYRCQRVDCMNATLNCPCGPQGDCRFLTTCDGTVCLSVQQKFVMQTPVPNSLEPTQHHALMSVYDEIACPRNFGGCPRFNVTAGCPPYLERDWPNDLKCVGGRVASLYACTLSIQKLGLLISFHRAIRAELNGTISTLIGLLTGLTSLNFDTNYYIGGTVPTEIVKLTALTSLYVSFLPSLSSPLHF